MTDRERLDGAVNPPRSIGFFLLIRCGLEKPVAIPIAAGSWKEATDRAFPLRAACGADDVQATLVWDGEAV